MSACGEDARRAARAVSQTAPIDLAFQENNLHILSCWQISSRLWQSAAMGDTRVAPYYTPWRERNVIRRVVMPT
jgi:hypothetical protein